MKLIIGGAAQGKRAYVRTAYRIAGSELLDGERCPLLPSRAAALDRLHLLVRRALLAGLDPAVLVLRLVEGNPDIVLICDEIGCGIVPIDPFERRWREETGRLCRTLAARAGRVERVFCGIAQTIKGEA